jgi:hypothetical protein
MTAPTALPVAVSSATVASTAFFVLTRTMYRGNGPDLASLLPVGVPNDSNRGPVVVAGFRLFTEPASALMAGPARMAHMHATAMINVNRLHGGASACAEGKGRPGLR